jgi:hypothetical protein
MLFWSSVTFFTEYHFIKGEKMKPNISEFSYGYAITDELIHWRGTHITAVPVFPSLYEEGQRGGGWDVKLDRRGIPLFLQFKLSDKMIRNNAKECKMGLFSPPLYRMYIRPSLFSDQHKMLLDLENEGNEVYYTAPAFHEPWELNEAYLNHSVNINSIWVRPSWIGSLPDRRSHHVAFQQPGEKFFLSKYRLMEENVDFSSFSRSIDLSIKERGEFSLRQQNLSKISDQIVSISSRRTRLPRKYFNIVKERAEELKPIQKIAFYSSMFLGSQLFVVSESE